MPAMDGLPAVIISLMGLNRRCWCRGGGVGVVVAVTVVVMVVVMTIVLALQVVHVVVVVGEVGELSSWF